MNIFTRLQQLSKLTNNETILVDYICDNPDELIKKDINQLCQDIYISKATVYRLCKKIGIKGYSDLRVIIASQLETDKNLDMNYNYPFLPNQTQSQIINGLHDLYTQTIENTRNLIDLDEFYLAVQELLNAKKIKIFPSVGNIFMAESFQQNMIEIGVLVDVVTYDFNQHWSSCASKEGDVVIVISYLGKTRDMLETVKLLKRKKAKIIFISATYEENICNYVDHHLYICSFEHFQRKIASFSSRVSVQYLLDCLYACYFNQNYDKNIQYKVTNYID